MNTRRIVTIVASLLLAYSVFDLMYVETGIRAMANDEQALFIPDPNDVNGVNGRTDRAHSSGFLREKNKTPAVTVRRHAEADSLASAKAATQPRDTATVKFIRVAMPWVAGILGLGGLGMVAYSLLIRRQRAPNQAARSAVQLHSVEAGWSNRKPARTGLALRLVRNELAQSPPASEDEEESRETRKAA